MGVIRIRYLYPPFCRRLSDGYVGLDKRWLKKYDIDADSIAGLIPFSGQVISHFSYRKMNGIDNLQLLLMNCSFVSCSARMLRLWFSLQATGN